MSLISITSDSGDAEDLFKAPEYPVLPAGKHLLAVKNKLEVIDSSTGSSDLIKAEFICQDEDENKGIVVFENFVFLKESDTDGKRKSLSINQARFAQFTVACGVSTESQVKAGEKFDLDEFEGKAFSASTVVKMEATQEVDANGTPIKAPKASVKKFLYEPESS